MMRQRGFTLLEVMVALAILAVTSLTLMQSTQSSTRTLAQLEERTLAHWLLMNQAARAQMATGLPAMGEFHDDQDYAGRRWRVSTQVEATAAPGVRKITLYAALQQESSLQTTEPSPITSLVVYVSDMSRVSGGAQ